jgi:hypothetical protein
MKRYYPWLIAGFISLFGTIQAIHNLPDNAALVHFIGEFFIVLVIVLFSFMGALIVIRQGGNRVGWLMMMAAFAIAHPFVFLVSFLPSPPIILTLIDWLLLWVQSWFWLLAIISIFQIVLNFPDGRPPSTRWNWINAVTLVTIFLLALMAMFSERIGPTNKAWAVDNPLNFLPPPLFQGGTLLSGIGMFVLASGSLTSLFFRFRRGRHVERAQIKWLLFAGALILPAFGLVFAYYMNAPGTSDGVSWQEAFAMISLLLFPLALISAILRHRLYDIDIIIRRTLIYGILTALLALTYFGGIVLLQNIFGQMVGDTKSPMITVISTLAIVALFNPLRTRIQTFIDRRFYRRKYDAEQILARFSAAARDEVDLERLTSALLATVEETMQPDHVNLWLRKTHEGKSQ